MFQLNFFWTRKMYDVEKFSTMLVWIRECLIEHIYTFQYVSFGVLYSPSIHGLQFTSFIFNEGDYFEDDL